MSDCSISVGFLDAIKRLECQMAQLEKADLRTVTLDPVAAAVTLRRVLPSIRALRRQLLELSGFEIRVLDDIEIYLHAWLGASALFLGTVPSAKEFLSRVEKVASFRARFASDAAALVQRGRLQAESLERLHGASGYENIAADVLTLSALFRENWEKIAGHSCVTLAELDEADAAVDDFLTALALRSESSVDRVAAAIIRRKTYTLFVNAYDQIRRAVIFVRRNERDGNEIAPSLFAARNRKK